MANVDQGFAYELFIEILRSSFYAKLYISVEKRLYC